MTDKTLKTLEQRAREAWVNDASVSPSDEDCFAAYVSGYLAAAREAEQEIAALRARVAELEAQIDDYEERMSHVPAGFFA